MKDIEQKWRKLAEEVTSGMKEWRDQNPRATYREIEETLDKSLARMRARMLEDVALASRATEWSQVEGEERPTCEHCGTRLVSRGKKERHLQTQGGQEVVLKRSYGVCPTCGIGLFPPGQGIGFGGGVAQS
jgi:YgiT-type zinc finger domain-containing protein